MSCHHHGHKSPHTISKTANLLQHWNVKKLWKPCLTKLSLTPNRPTGLEYFDDVDSNIKSIFQTKKLFILLANIHISLNGLNFKQIYKQVKNHLKKTSKFWKLFNELFPAKQRQILRYVELFNYLFNYFYWVESIFEVSFKFNYTVYTFSKWTKG